MEIYERNFTGSIIDGIREMISTNPDISRLELSRRVCEWMNWRSPNGKLKDMSCRKALLTLHRRGRITLPKKEKLYGFEKRRSKEIGFKVAELHGSLSELEDIVIEPICSRYSRDSKIWFQLLDKFHYLRGGRLCGAQLRYIVKSGRYGYIGALGFSSATWKLRARDEYIGWTEQGRREHLRQVISNGRFLIVPTVRVQNLASYILGQVLLRLPSDWQERYGIRPFLVETYVDPSRYEGCCYRAANWKYIGDTSGRRDGISKRIFIYPLHRRWREYLCEEGSVSLGSTEGVSDPGNWAEVEFGSIRLYDNRLKERLYVIAQDFYNKPEANIPEACGSKARSTGAYRFFRNEKVSMEVIIDAHTEATIDRIKGHRVVLAPQDTTTLDYTTHPMTEGLGPLGSVVSGKVGLILHDTLAFSEEGTPLGVLDAQCWARDPQDRGKKYHRKERPLEQKESMKWIRSFRRVSEIQKLCPDTMLVSMGDRESDIFDLFEEAKRDPRAPRLLVRAERSRRRRVEQEELWEYMSHQEIAGTLRIHIPRRGSRKARDSDVDLRYGEVELSPPKRLDSSGPVRVWVVYIKESSDEDVGGSAVEWMLLSTVEVKSFHDARRLVEWYTRRWGMEVYHRTLKSGCRIKDRQLGTADRLEVSVGIDMVVAWRIYHMTMLGREIPEAPCTVFFKEEQWKALHCYVYKTPVAPEQPPSLKEAIGMLGKIGGHMGRRSDGEPGTQTLWRGLQRLDTATEMYVIFTTNPPTDLPRDSP